MRNLKYILLVFVFCLHQANTMAEVKFRTAELQRLATAINIQPESLQEGYQTIKPTTQAIVIHVDENSIVDHIGLPLFSESMKKIGNRVVMEFIERYLLQLHYPPTTKTATMMMRDDNVKFENGSIATLKQLRPTDQFNLNCERMRYAATWMRDSKTLLTLTFPAEFELLRGMNFIEAQHGFEGESQKTLKKKMVKAPLDKQQMKATKIKGCYMLEGGSYLNKTLNANRYYIETENGQLRPLLSEDHPAESAANLMLCPEIAGQRKLQITERLYGFQEKNFNMNLSQWIAFCQEEKCRLYFGIQELTTTSVKATVIAVNDEENYNHLLSLEIPYSAISNPNGVIVAQLNCYLPTHNIRNLFGIDNSKKKAKYHL